jgi:hypothetical protein
MIIFSIWIATLYDFHMKDIYTNLSELSWTLKEKTIDALASSIFADLRWGLIDLVEGDPRWLSWSTTIDAL